MRLPDPSDVRFGGVYASLKGHRARRERTPNVAVMTVSMLVRQYQQSPQFRKLAEATQRNYTRYLGNVASDPGFKDAPAAEVRRGDVQKLIDSMGDRTGAANVTIKVIRALYARAKKRDLVETNPAADIDGSDSTPHAPWPEALLEAASKDEQVRLPVALLYYTAQRVSDVAAARWTDIDSGSFKVRQQKTGRVLTYRCTATWPPSWRRRRTAR